jgi:hypothetical protein
MGKINLYAPFAGVKDGLTLCTLLSDKKRLKEVMGVVEILDGRITEINEAIEILGKASEMDVLLRKAKQKDQEALFALNEAKEAAGQIQRDAKSWADELRAKTVEREDAVTIVEKALAEDKSRFNADAVSWQATKVKREAELADQKQLTTRKLGEVEQLKERYETALGSMKAGVAAA